MVEGLAVRIVQARVPEFLRHKRVYSLDMSSVVAGTQYRGQFEERMKKIVAEMSESDGDILFLDEMHTMMGAGAGGGSMDAGNILKYVILNCLFFFSFFSFFSF